MPGPVSDSYDPEWGTGSNREEIGNALDTMYQKVSKILGNRPPIYILHLLQMDLPDSIEVSMTEQEWRLLRFALERARESL